MKAAVVKNHQLTDAEIPNPVPDKHELLIEVKATAINPIDAKRIAMIAENDPQIVGYDAVGIVKEVGADVKKFRPGAMVFYAGSTKNNGSFAELQTVDEDLVSLVPRNLTLPEIAAMPLTWMTAYEILVDKLNFIPRENANNAKIFVINGAGGVGSILTQLAHWMGITVAATSSPANFDWLKQNHVDYQIDYHKSIAEQLSDELMGNFDAVINLFDTDRYFKTAIELVRPFGQIISVANAKENFDLNSLKPKSLSFGWEYMFTKTDTNYRPESQGQELQLLASLLEQGEIKSTLTKTITAPLSAETVSQALELLSEQHTTGKIVLEFEK